MLVPALARWTLATGTGRPANVISDADVRRLAQRLRTPSRPILMMQPLTIHLPDAAATQTLGIALGRSLPPGTILLLSGDLGAGKTSLVQGIGAGLGITEPITSPTFTLIQEYLEGRIPLYHLDLYRLGPSDVPGLFLEQYWEGIEFPLGIMAIEWAERLPSVPESYIQIEMSVTEGDRRTATLQTVGNFEIQLSSLLEAVPQNEFVL